MGGVTFASYVKNGPKKIIDSFPKIRIFSLIFPILQFQKRMRAARAFKQGMGSGDLCKNIPQGALNLGVN